VQIPPGVKATVPVGAVAPEVEVSVTMARQELVWSTTTVDGVQLMLVEVG